MAVSSPDGILELQDEPLMIKTLADHQGEKGGIGKKKAQSAPVLAHSALIVAIL